MNSQDLHKHYIKRKNLQSNIYQCVHPVGRMIFAVIPCIVSFTGTETSYTYILCVCLYIVFVSAFSTDYVHTMTYSCVTTSSESATHDRKGVMRVWSA